MRFGGVVLAAFGAVLAGRAAILLTGRGRPQRGPRPAFVLAGPYLRLRNPLFAGIVLVIAGCGFATGRWSAVILAIGTAGAAHTWVVRREEPRLLARFGAAYAEYCRRVPRWIPHRRPTAWDPDTVS